MSLLVLVRLAKLLSVTALVSGSVMTVMSSTQADRQRAAYLLTGPAFLTTWLLGFVLAGLIGHSYFEPFILGGLALSMTSLQGVLYIAGKEGRRTPISVAVVLVPLFATFVLMVVRPD